MFLTSEEHGDPRAPRLRAGGLLQSAAEKEGTNLEYFQAFFLEAKVVIWL